MASKAAQKRLSKEYVAMQREPPPFIWAVPDEKNILTWNYLIRGPPDSPFSGGEYHGVLLFPPEYPFKPPGIKMYTPSGRFQPDRKICFSMSDFHPGSWNPAWSVATILTGLLSFMLSDEMTTGSVNTTEAHKRAFAQRSHAWNIGQSRFREAFPEHASPEMRDLPNMGEKERGIPDSASSTAAPTSTSASTASTSSSAPPPTPRCTASSLTLPTSPTVFRDSGPKGTTVAPPPRANGTGPDPANRAVAPAGGGPQEATGGWLGWRHFFYEKWRLCAVIAVALVVSRFSARA